MEKDRFTQFADVIWSGRGPKSADQLIAEDPTLVHARGYYRGYINATALHIVAYHAERCHYLVEKLVEMGADVNATDDSGFTPLHLAACGYVMGRAGESVRTVRFLIQHGANVNARSNSGETALHGASKSNYYDVARVLLEAGANPSLEDSNGVTPAQAASQSALADILSKKQKGGGCAGVAAAVLSAIVILVILIIGVNVVAA